MSFERNGTDVSHETNADLDRFQALVAKWSPKINLVSKASLSELRPRHIEDSLQLWPLLPPVNHVADLGSGGGFPGIVLAICAKHSAPNTSVTLIESDRRKSVFLQTAIRELGLNAKVLTLRIEEAPPQGAHIITARALASCDQLFTYAAPHLKPGGALFLLKGEKASKELEEARENWHFSLETHPSQTQSGAVILEIGDLRRD